MRYTLILLITVFSICCKHSYPSTMVVLEIEHQVGHFYIDTTWTTPVRSTPSYMVVTRKYDDEDWWVYCVEYGTENLYWVNVPKQIADTIKPYQILNTKQEWFEDL